jgi:hypothetical protein
MKGPSGIKSGPHITAKTFSIHVLRQALDRLTRTLKKFNRTGYLLLKVNSQNIEILPPTRKGEANVLLTVSEYGHVYESLPSEQARDILAFRGYRSVFLISKIEKPDPLDPSLEKHVGDIALESNRNVLKSITSELRTPRLVTLTSENANWCKNTRQWATLSDPEGKIIKPLDNGNILIMGLDTESMKTLSELYEQIAHDFQTERRIQLPSQTAIEHASTAIQEIREPFGLVIASGNIIVIEEELEKSPELARINLKANPANGVVSIVPDPKSANIALTFKRHIINVTAGFQASLPIALVNGLYLEPTLLDGHFLHPSLRGRINIQKFFTEMVTDLNNTLGKSFVDSVKAKTGKQISNHELAPIEKQLLTLKGAEFIVRTWLK